MLCGGKAITRTGHGLDDRDLRRVRIVAVHTVIPFARAARAIPISGHPPVAAVLVIAELRAVTLRTKLHRIGERDRRPIGQMQPGIAALRVMTRDAGELSVIQLQALMELIEILRRPVLPVGRSRGVTRRTGDGG